ncbi:Bug family tripartite tricarboxylate transporter substrate binding protein [Alsobacter sp. R-9]
MRSLLGAIVGAAASAFLVGGAAAEPAAYPHKVVTLVTHSSPGAGSDIFLRELAKQLPKYINATFVVENVSGGSGARAMTKLATSKPDGSVFYATTPTFVFTSLLSKPQNTYKDLQPLVNFFTDPTLLYTRADGPFKTLDDVIKSAKEKRGRWGASTPSSMERQAAELLKKNANVQAAVVSHDGGGELLLNVLNGTLDIGVGEYVELRPQIEAGKVRILATFTDKRVAALPDVPTVKELGYNVVLRKYRGLAGPQGLPPDVIAIWEKAAQQLLADPEYLKVVSGEALIPDFIPQKDYAAFIAKFADESEAFFKENGVIK